MDGRMNCWLHGFLQTAVIVVVTWVPMLWIHGWPEGRGWMLVGTAICMLGLGTLALGGVEVLQRRLRRRRDGRSGNPENDDRNNGN